MRRLLLLVLLAGVAATALPQARAAQAASQTFPQTGKTAAGIFLSYWQGHGGLAQQGYPISDELVETNATDGKPYRVQYFERAVFEYHPENAAPNNILLSLLGVFYYHQKYPSGAPGQVPNTARGSVSFSQTGHRLGGLFQHYWQNHGGLAQQGYPISDEFTEVAADGKPYTVQYFERAVFEYHPANVDPYKVLLARLGATSLAARYPGGAPAAAGLSLEARLDLFESVWQTVRDNYVYTDYRGLDWNAFHQEYRARVAQAANNTTMYDALADMITRLGDRHSSFLNPEEVEEEDALQRGDLHFSGIGVFSQDLGGKVRIVYVVPGGPADQAGIHAFDVIQAVNSVPLTQSQDAPRQIRGPPGTTVTLTIARPGEAAPREITITRNTVTFALHATARRWPGTNIAVLQLPTFNADGIADEAASALQRLAASGPLDGVVVDIRQNGGGLISELNDMLGLFVDGGSGGFEATRQGRYEDRITRGRVIAALRGKPMVVLTSNASESASERFAAVLQDVHRATILGTNTAGNTETVYPHDMPQGARLMLAQATYLRTDGKTSIEDKGVVPDIVLDVPWFEAAPDADPQIQGAVA
ncbi:MAG TPA: S41 family peptidase, partial [Chloroflexia bacterium]|nr:S41 family peptidase [Chloroflexia bacterium]